ncbi:Z1 domain-containing protein [Streptomyces sp. 1114.5]|uniref:Z1 domain-containing protein n=1 Tax=Streptomyces sp. 1114.5 TaxID=1938830 RepID=UPI000EB32DDD|nr:Z1 domain-containing protein [Streptomyces sp. 1114.5]
MLKKPRADLSPVALDLVVALRAAFRVIGMSIRNFARSTPWDYSTVSRYLSGDRFPTREFIKYLIERAQKKQFSAHDAENVERLYEKAQEEREAPEHQMRTLVAQVRVKEERAQAADRRSKETSADLDRARRVNQRLKTQVKVLSWALDNGRGLLLSEHDDVLLAELEGFSTARQAGDRGAAACVSNGVLATWRKTLGRADTAPSLAWTRARPGTPERRRHTYDRLGLEQRPREALDELVPLPRTVSEPTDEATVKLYEQAIGILASTGPRPLAEVLAFVAEGQPTIPVFEQHVMCSHLTTAGRASTLTDSWRDLITAWDNAMHPWWTETLPRTAGRRIAAYEALGLEPDTRRGFTELIPIPFADGPIIIGEALRPWSAPAYQSIGPWYWPACARYLGVFKAWPVETVAGIDDAAEAVADRLADPTDPVAYQTKGLVVGYVQSGKTSNMAAVIAKAIDRGYRLVILLSGSYDILREQTQRRLDMELVGRENILRDGPEEDSDYVDDPAWQQGEFISHGDRPSRLGAFDIVRLTTRRSDYRSLRQGIAALEFEKAEPTLPLYHPRNLHRSAVRLMVVKKNKAVLAKVVADLRRLGRQLGEIPVLIVDDESDYGSVNTAYPATKRGNATRSAINALITGLLEALPRAQYVAYTATPFANVLINPTDEEDLFPRDFVIALPRPVGYMGAREFHDLDLHIPQDERTVSNSNELAHVRSIGVTGAEDVVELGRAMGSFLLAAAVKLYREANDPSGIRYRHHTMLVHESVRIAAHHELAHKITQLWEADGADPDGSLARLRNLFDSDFAPVSADRHGGFVNPASFDDLIPHLATARARIGADGGPVVVVNGDADIERGAVDFDHRPVWKILVGGAKLSRGFTVEGLTITYFRRSTRQADSLMQMGRWFGFRTGYEDLVRLYIDRGVGSGMSFDRSLFGARSLDLYEAFEAALRDEEAFRAQLTEYAQPVDGQPAITPAQIPPLVAQYMPELKPTSASKMFHARPVPVHAVDQWIEPTAYPTGNAQNQRNSELWRPVLAALHGASVKFSLPASGGKRAAAFSARTAVISHAQLLDVLGGLQWEQPDSFARDLAYLKSLRSTTAKLSEWLVIAPQLASANPVTSTLPGAPLLSVFRRSRRRPGAFGAISDPGHRRVARELLSDGDRGIVLLYPVVERGEALDLEVEPAQVTVAFALLTPKNVRRDGHEPAMHFRAGDR